MFSEACRKGTGRVPHLHHPAGLTCNQTDQVVALARKASPYLHVTSWTLNRGVCTQVRTSFTFRSNASDGAWRCGPETCLQSRRHNHVAKVEVLFEGDKGPVPKRLSYCGAGLQGVSLSGGSGRQEGCVDEIDWSVVVGRWTRTEDRESGDLLNTLECLVNNQVGVVPGCE